MRFAAGVVHGREMRVPGLALNMQPVVNLVCIGGKAGADAACGLYPDQGFVAIWLAREKLAQAIELPPDQGPEIDREQSPV